MNIQIDTNYIQSKTNLPLDTIVSDINKALADYTLVYPWLYDGHDHPERALAFAKIICHKLYNIA